MRCLVVGTDRLGAAPKILKNKFGVTEIIHWDARRCRSYLTAYH